MAKSSAAPVQGSGQTGELQKQLLVLQDQLAQQVARAQEADQKGQKASAGPRSSAYSNRSTCSPPQLSSNETKESSSVLETSQLRNYPPSHCPSHPSQISSPPKPRCARCSLSSKTSRLSSPPGQPHQAMSTRRFVPSLSVEMCGRLNLGNRGVSEMSCEASRERGSSYFSKKIIQLRSLH